jgi:cytoskeletal protein CcmA (bactofilin family)
MSNMADVDTQVTVIAADTHIRGEMTFDRTAKLLGKFDGKVSAKGELQVAEGAICKAEIDAGKVIVDGMIEGNVSAHERIQLNTKARIKGDLKAARLVVAEGASLIGHCAIGPDALKGTPSPEIKTIPQQNPVRPIETPRK